ncbi:hypothetical protein Bca52824_061934 [Brassica carinata]|uniref:Uncharacterized protein n=1 Tax=Brassica carinata TaxID=52824 RepID=A0A8X7QBR3_BRACI|nr:hypothetical protein Bca52824_061934 [Brassica carinata]
MTNRKLAGLANTITRPARAQRKLEELVPVIRRQGNDFSPTNVEMRYSATETSSPPPVFRGVEGAPPMSLSPPKASPSQSIA